jgi:hypothetical protein
MGWMHFLNSDDVVAVLNAILPFMDANTAMPPFWIENKIFMKIEHIKNLRVIFWLRELNRY